MEPLPSIDERRFELDTGTKNRELDLREREIAAKEREVATKELELKRSRWLNPTAFGLFAATLGLIGSVIVARVNNENTQTVERMRSESSLVLEAIKTGNPDNACKNLVFFVKSKLLNDPAQTEAIRTQCASAPQGPPSLPITPPVAGQQALDCNWPAEPNKIVLKAGNGFDVWVGGLNHDVIAIKRGDELLVCDGIRNSWQGGGGENSRPDGATSKGILAQDVMIGTNLIAVVFGRNLDMARLYGLSEVAASHIWNVQVVDWPNGDGTFRIQPAGDEMLFTFGKNYNGLWTRKVCWKAGVWTSSAQSTPPNYAACEIPMPPIGKEPVVGTDRPNGPRQILPKP